MGTGHFLAWADQDEPSADQFLIVAEPTSTALVDDGGETEADVVFTDDFDRPDGAVGNGWSPLIGQGGVAMVIDDGALTAPLPEPAPAVHTGVYRPLDFTGPVTLECDITEANGFGGLADRYFWQFLVASDGTAGSGYGIQVYRGDQNFNNSAIVLIDNDGTVATLLSSFQFSDVLHLEVTFNPDGSVSGTVSQPGSSFDFAFPAYDFAAGGSNIALVAYDLDNTGGPYTEPTLDNLVITVSDAGNSDPDANSEAYYVNRSGALVVADNLGVLANDEDADGDSLLVSEVNGSAASVGQVVQGLFGRLTLHADGSFTYVANVDRVSGVDTFDYTVSDGLGGETTATLQFKVNQSGAVEVELPFDGDFPISYGPSSSHHQAQRGANWAYDFATPLGTEVLSVGAGVVVDLRSFVPDGGLASGDKFDPSRGAGGFGNYVTVKLDSGIFVTYMHLAQDGVSVEIGERVETGDLLGITGSTGVRTAPHLHVQFGTSWYASPSINGSTDPSNGVVNIIADGDRDQNPPIVFDDPGDGPFPNRVELADAVLFEDPGQPPERALHGEQAADWWMF